MSLVEHLEELRYRLFVCIGAYIVMAIVAYIFYRPILDFMLHPLHHSGTVGSITGSKLTSLINPSIHFIPPDNRMGSALGGRFRASDSSRLLAFINWRSVPINRMDSLRHKVSSRLHMGFPSIFLRPGPRRGR